MEEKPQKETIQVEVAPEEVVPIVSEAPKQKPWLIIGLVALVLLLLGTTGFFAYQNYQLKQQVLQNQPAPLPEVSRQPETPSPTPTENPVSSWKTYSSESIGISLKYPQGDILQEPQLEASLSIKYSDNKYVN